MIPNEAIKIIDKVHDYPCPYGIGGTAWRFIRSCIEKQIPKKPLDIQTPVVTWGICPTCKGELILFGGKPNRVFLSNSHCPDCGQALDWSDENDS